MLDELSDPGQIVFCELFNIIVSSEVNDVRFKVFVCTVFIKAVCVRDVDYFIPLTVHYVDWTVEIFDTVDVWEFVEPESPSEVAEDYSQDAH